MRIAGICLLMLPCFAATAQQDPLYAQYLLNPASVNPAWVGLNNDVGVMVGYRTQWTSFEGQPQTFNVAANASLLNNTAGAGIVMVNDRIGNISNMETNAQFAYRLDLDAMVLSFGMQAGFQTFDTDYAALKVLDPGDDAFVGGARGSRMNIGAGAVLRNENFAIGISVPRLMPSTFGEGAQSFELYNQHFYLTAAYVHYVNEHLRFRPSLLLRGVKGAPASMDVAASFHINNRHTFGIFTRNFGSYGLMLQTLMKEQLQFGYVFEMPTARSVGAAFPTHEIVLGIRFNAFAFHEKSYGNF